MHKKRGQSFWTVVVDPSAKRFLNQCVLCGRVGLKPAALDADYSAIEHEKTVPHQQKSAVFDQELAFKNLGGRYEPLSLDKFGRCEICAGTTERDDHVA